MILLILNTLAPNLVQKKYVKKRPLRAADVPPLVWVKGFARSSVRWTVVEQIRWGFSLFLISLSLFQSG